MVAPRRAATRVAPVNARCRWQRPLSVLLVIVALAGNLLAASAIQQKASPASPVIAE